MDNYGQSTCLKKTPQLWTLAYGNTCVGNEIAQTVDCCLDGNGSLHCKGLCNGIVRLDKTPQTTLLLACGAT